MRFYLVDETSKAVEVALVDRPLDELLRRAAAAAHVEAEEESAAVSSRLTIPVFHGEPWC